MDWMQECRDRSEKTRLISFKDRLVKAKQTLCEMTTQMPLIINGKGKIKQRAAPVEFGEDVEELERWPTPSPCFALDFTPRQAASEPSAPPIGPQAPDIVGPDIPDQAAAERLFWWRDQREQQVEDQVPWMFRVVKEDTMVC